MEWGKRDATGEFEQAGQKGERRPEQAHKRLLYCVNVNRTSLDHLLLGKQPMSTRCRMPRV
jgi:hypothetical protein